MQVSQLIIQRVPINVVDDLTWFCIRNLAMLPVFSVSRLNAWSAKSLSVNGAAMRLVRFLGHGSCRYGCNKTGNRASYFVPAPHVLARWKTCDLLCVSKQRVTMPMPHLVMPHTKVSSGDRAVAMFTRPTYVFAAPFVLGCSILLNTFVVHQTKAMRGMLSAAILDRTEPCVSAVCHWVKPVKLLPRLYTRYKVVGNYPPE